MKISLKTLHLGYSIHQRRGVRKTPSNIYEGDFCKNSKEHSVVNCFCEKLHPRSLPGFLIHYKMVVREFSIYKRGLKKIKNKLITQDSVKMKNIPHIIAKSIMFQQTILDFLAKFKANCNKLGQKRHATVFQRHFALYYIL